MQRVTVPPRVVAALATFAAASAAAQTPAATPPSVLPSANSPNQKLASPPNANAVEQIIVTANKRRELQRQVANSVTAISGRDLARRQEVSLQDLASQVPGLSLEADDKTAVRIILRGLNTGSPGATVATVIDDVPTNATGGQTNAALNSPNYDTYDLQRIEVLRGPQSSLYGATAEGGLVKYVTNAPDPTAYSGSLEAGIEGNTDGGIGGALRGYGNFPLLDGKAAVRISAWNDWFPGYVDDPERDKTNINSAQQYGWRASLLVTPTADLSIRLTAERQTLISNGADDIEVTGAALTPLTPPVNQLGILHGLVNNTALPQPSQNESGVYYGNVNYDLGWASLTSLTSYAFNNFRSLFDYSNLNLAPGTTYADYLQQAAYGVPLYLGERQNSNGDKFNQEVRLASDPGLQVLGRDLNWLGGFYYTHENTSFLQGYDAHDAADISNILTQPIPGGQIAQYSSLSEWAVFGQVDYTILPRFDVALGGGSAAPRNVHRRSTSPAR